MKTLVYSTHSFDKPFLERAAKGKHEIVFTELPLQMATAHMAEGFEAVALFTSDNASGQVVECLHNAGVRFIALRSVGYDHVDLAKAKDRNIRVANVPAYSPYAIAEHAVTLLLSVNRKIVHSQTLLHRNDFRLDSLVGFDVHGKTVGVIGTGKIGAAFARIMNGFGCRILAYDIELNNELMHQINIQYTSLEDLCKNADIISVHCPLTEQTKYMFNASTFALMKPGVVFINTARGGIVNTVDLIESIEQGIVSAAGLDVYEYEKPIFFYDHTSGQIDDPVFEKLRSFHNVLITGHQAFLTHEALEAIATTTADNLTQWETTGISTNELS